MVKRSKSNKDIFLRGFAKALEEQWQVVVRLKARDSDEDSDIFAHKLVLASRSEVLKKILELDEFKAPSQPAKTARPSLRVGRGGMGVGPVLNIKKKMIRERSKKQRKNKYVRSCETVTFSELNLEELEAFVKFIYSDGSRLSAKAKEHVRSLYVAADKYEIPHLRDLCRNELISSLNASNALDVYELAQIPFDGALNDAALGCIQMNIPTIACSYEFKLFAESNPNLTVEIMKACVERGRNNPYRCNWGGCPC